MLNRLMISFRYTTLVCILATSLVYSQAGFTQTGQDTDLQLWTSTIVKTKVHDNIDLQVRNIIRFDDNISRFARFAPEPRLNFKARKWLNLYLGYRFSLDPKRSGGVNTEHRLFGGFQLKHKLKKLKLSYRFIFQEDLYQAELTNDEHGWTNDNVIRQRLGLDMKITKWLHPYIQYEHFLDLQSASGHGPREYRYTLGNQLKFSKAHQLSLYLRQDNPFNNQDDIVRMIGIKYTYVL